MRTPIDDFVRRYADGDAVRLHMPGHKGIGAAEACDITEIDGADSLFEASGIIRESEERAGELFGAHTLYSTEGSSLCIRAMLYLARKDALREGRETTVLAARNAHRTLIGATALLDMDVAWLYPRAQDGYLACTVTAEDVRVYLSTHKAPAAVYLTSPDYLGNRQDIRAIAAVCHAYGTRLLVDNAHGAYLAFLEPNGHPIAQGADLCCDSAHKTLPVLTGGAYLHIAREAPAAMHAEAKVAMAQFASTSPSYLILASLDRANRTLSEDYRSRLAATVHAVRSLRERLTAYGYGVRGDEPMKLTLCPHPLGYTGTELAAYLRSAGFVCEMADATYTVLMPSVATSPEDLRRLEAALCTLCRRPALSLSSPAFHRPQAVMSAREAMLSPDECLPLEHCLGRVVSVATVGCPPAVPIVMPGERVDEQALSLLAYYGTRELRVICQ